MKPRYVKSLAMAAFSALGTLPAVAQAQLIDLGATTGYALNNLNATSCSATGGGESDGWPGSKATSGSQAVTESFAPTTGTVTLIYTITCTSSTSGLTSHASAQVDESQPPPSSGGGGFDLSSLAGLTSLLALRLRRSRRREVVYQ